MDRSPDPLPEEQPSARPPTTDLAGLVASRRALDARQTGDEHPTPDEPPRPPSDLTATMPIIVPSDMTQGRRGHPDDYPGRHRGGMRIPRRVLTATGILAAAGAAIGLAFAVTGGSSPSSAPPLGAQLPDGGAGLTAAPESTPTNGTAAASATASASTSTGPTRSRPSRTSTPQPTVLHPVASPTPFPSTTPSSAPSTTPGTSTSPTPSSTPSSMAVIGTCHMAWTVAAVWNGGFQLGFTLTNSGTAPTSGWSVSYSWPGAQTVTQIWDAASAQSGATVSITNLSYDATVSPGGSRPFGLNANGNAPSTLTGLQCTAR